MERSNIKDEMIVYRLAETRRKKGMTQQQLAEAIGKTVGAIRNIEQGITDTITRDTLNKLCKTLNCNVQDIMVFVED